MNTLSSTLIFSKLAGMLPTLKKQLDPKCFPKYTIPMSYYESYFNILSVKKYPLVAATIKAAKEGKIKLINHADPFNFSDEKTNLSDAISTVALPVSGPNKFEIYVNASKKTGYIRNVDKEPIGLKTNEVALYSYLQSGFVSYLLATKDLEITNNIKLHTILAEIYSNVIGKAINRLYPITGEDEGMTRLHFLLAMYYFQVMCGYDFKKAINVALTVKNVDPIAISRKSRAFAAEKLLMKDFNDFLEVFSIEFPFVNKKSISLPAVVVQVTHDYGQSAMFIIEHFQSFLNMVEAVTAHANLYHDQALSGADGIPSPLARKVESILLLISGA